jgi:hypothetical protein
MHYRAVILVLASNNNEIYKNGRKVWKKYMNIDPTIKVYFVYGRLFEPLEDQDENDFIFSNIDGGHPISIDRTVEAMKIIQSKVTYDFFIRTNISTFWDFEKLHLHLNDLPTKQCYSGDGPLPGYNSNGFYLSGTDTIVTPEMIDMMINNIHLIDFQIVEDAAMGKFFHSVLGIPMLPNRICFFEDITSIQETIEERIVHARMQNKDHYRVKTLYGDRESIDLYIYKILLKKIYNME